MLKIKLINLNVIRVHGFRIKYLHKIWLIEKNIHSKKAFFEILRINVINFDFVSHVEKLKRNINNYIF